MASRCWSNLRTTSLFGRVTQSLLLSLPRRQHVTACEEGCSSPRASMCDVVRARVVVRSIMIVRFTRVPRMKRYPPTRRKLPVTRVQEQALVRSCDYMTYRRCSLSLRVTLHTTIGWFKTMCPKFKDVGPVRSCTCLSCMYGTFYFTLRYSGEPKPSTRPISRRQSVANRSTLTLVGTSSASHHK